MNPIKLAGQKGSSLIVVIMVAAFMLGVGGVLILLTNTGKKISSNISTQEEAFNAAEAGFELGRIVIEDNFISGNWADLDENCLRLPAGIDLPLYDNYFRKLTDEELIKVISPVSPGVVFYDEPYIRTGSTTFDQHITFTVFLIDDEAGGALSDPSDVLMVCIGTVKSGNRIVSTSRLEVFLGVDVGGTTP